MKPIFDSHAHLDMVLDRGLSLNDIEASLVENNVQGFVQIGTNEITSLKAQMIAHDPPLNTKIFYTVGCHPCDLEEMKNIYYVESFLEKCATDSLWVAIGEIGLDYYYDMANKKKQIEVFQGYLDYAIKYQKPICIHTRDAHKDTLSVLQKHYLPSATSPFLIHCFTGNKQQMFDYLALGAYISFSGIVTFRNAKENQEAALACPLDKMLIETDAPYLTPVPYRGKINHPGLLRHTLNFIAKLKGISEDTLAEYTFKNTHDFYNILKS